MCFEILLSRHTDCQVQPTLFIKYPSIHCSSFFKLFLTFDSFQNQWANFKQTVHRAFLKKCANLRGKLLYTFSIERHTEAIRENGVIFRNHFFSRTTRSKTSKLSLLYHRAVKGVCGGGISNGFNSFRLLLFETIRREKFKF